MLDATHMTREVWECAIVVVLCPLIWNAIARFEYKTRAITRAVGSRYTGCYLLATWIFCFSLYRDYKFKEAIDPQPPAAAFDNALVKLLAVALYCFGLVMVLSSMWVLGVTGTYLGDYFGILMDAKVEGFPFNVMNNPMYNGSSILFLSHALWTAKPMGAILAGWVFIVYRFAIIFEGSFTSYIYANRHKKHGPALPKSYDRDPAMPLRRALGKLLGGKSAGKKTF
eukprot:tig00022075_g23622.t1